MFSGWLKSLIPRSLFGRTALILLVPILTIQLVVSYVFIQRLYQNVTVQMTRSILPSLRLIEEEINLAPDRETARASVAPLAQDLRINVGFNVPPPAADARIWYDVSGRVVTATLREEGLPVSAIDLASDTRSVQLRLETQHGPVEIAFPRNRVSASNPHQLLVLMVFVSTIATIISFLFLRNQVRPIRRLALAASAFGKGRVLPYSPSGASEVRLAGTAFLEMRDRIERHIEQRTRMLSGVSHDLRTPLTRMNLALSLTPEGPEAEALKREVHEMQGMLDTFLGFAQIDATETPVAVNPVTLAERVVERADRDGAAVALKPSEGAGTAQLRVVAVERALENLVSNALRYGQRATVSVEITPETVSFVVEDDGPGIPEDQREEAMKPFARLDPARNQDRGGSVGLGLSIVRDIARQHGGGLRLGTSDGLGGLKAELRLAR